MICVWFGQPDQAFAGQKRLNCIGLGNQVIVDAQGFALGCTNPNMSFISEDVDLRCTGLTECGGDNVAAASSPERNEPDDDDDDDDSGGGGDTGGPDCDGTE